MIAMRNRIEDTFLDVRYALRGFRRSPGLAVTALATLALGIGANTAIFTVVRAVLLKPLPYADSSRLVRLSVDTRGGAQDAGFEQIRYEHMQAAQSFSGIAAYFVAHEDMTLAGAGDPESVSVGRISHNLLAVLGVQPQLGRSFLPEEDTAGGHAAVLLSADLWRRRFASDPLIAGKTVDLNATPTTIVGVMPPGFAFPSAGLDAWVTRPEQYSGVPANVRRLAGYLMAVARLKPGVTLERARAELAVFSRQYAADHPNKARTSTRAEFLRDRMVANVRPLLWMLMGVVGFVLLIACANIAGLLLARAASRRTEFAVRRALGAPRGRLMAQLLAESLLLAGGGGAMGVALAAWAVAVVAHGNALALPRAGEIRPDGTVLLFAAGAAVISGVLLGLFPAFTASRTSLMESLRARGEGAVPSLRVGRTTVSIRGLLVVAQVSLCVVLLVGTGLLLESFARLTRVAAGFRPDGVLSLQIALPASRYDDWRKQNAFLDELLRRVSALPGVRAAAVARSAPLTVRTSTQAAIAELPPVLLGERPQAQMQTASPRYFDVLGIRLLRGRVFDDRDEPSAERPVLIVNESFARLFWPGYPRFNPIGTHVLVGNQQQGGSEIVGIVADVHEGPWSENTAPEMYLPLAFNALPTSHLLVGAQGDPRRLLAAVRAQVRAIDPQQSIADVKTLDERIADSFGQRRVILVLLAAFAAIALLLALVGIYGLIAQSVAQRTRELAIRAALGAQPRDTLALVLREAFALTLAGVVLGIGGALALTRFLGTLLFHVSASDPAIFAAIGLLALAASLAAAYLPARRATRIDPIEALR